MQAAVREDKGWLNETLKGTAGRFIGVLSKDDVVRHPVWNRCDLEDAAIITAMMIPVREPTVSATATMAEALEVVSKQFLCEGTISTPFHVRRW